MQGSIRQTIGLVFAANARRGGIPYPSWPDAAIYQGCNMVSFTGRKGAGLLIDPNAWLDTLPRDMTAARLCVQPRNAPNISDLQGVGLVGCGPLFLAHIEAPTPEAWYGEWQVTGEHETDQRIWSVAYQNMPNVITPLQEKPRLEVRGALLEALDDAIQFDAAHNTAFGRWFVAAKNALNDSSPLQGDYLTDLVATELLSLDDIQLFAACEKAWVFGGMGYWNDLCFDGEDQEIYRALSDRLFSAIIDGLISATNASARS